MNERDEINLRRTQQTLRERQTFSGTMTAAACAATVCGFFYFLNQPSQQSAAILMGCMAVLFVACARLFYCAAKLAEAQRALQPVRIRTRPEVIDVEVMD